MIKQFNPEYAPNRWVGFILLLAKIVDIPIELMERRKMEIEKECRSGMASNQIFID